MVGVVTAQDHDRWVPIDAHAKPLFSGKHAAAALRWFETMREPNEWALSVDDQCELLGGVPKRTLQSWKKKALEGDDVELSRDILERLSLLLGIYKAYKLIAPSSRQELATQWFNAPNQNPLFQGKSVKEYLITLGTMNALYSVRRYLDAARG